jgi:hypothetical protein
MAEHAWTVICQKTLVDPETDLYTLVDVFDRLLVHPSPDIPDIEAKLDEVKREGGKGIVLPAQLRIVSQWFRSDRSRPETAVCRLAITDPGGEMVFQQDISIELTQSVAQRITVKSDHFYVTLLGIYFFTVEKLRDNNGGWMEVARLPLQVVPVGQDPKTFPILPEPLSEPLPASPRKSSSRRGRARP